MGKSSKKNAKYGNGANTTSAKVVCPCDDPFQCICGNRPERPSRGHKWDSITQTWGGKGHKQRGASGQAAASSAAASIVSPLTSTTSSSAAALSARGEGWKKQSERGGESSSLSRSSSAVSSSTSQQENGNRKASPKIVANKLGGDSIGNNHVGKSKDTTTSTTSTVTAASPSSQCRPTLTNTTIQNATTKNNNTKVEEDERRRRNQEIATRRRKHQAILDANRPMEVYLSKDFRKRIERLLCMEQDNINGDDNFNNDASSCSENNDDDDDDGMESGIKEEEEMEDIDTHRQLVRDGFSSRDVLLAMKMIRTKRRAMTNTKIGGETISYYEEVLQHLCIRLNEDDLPSGFDPRGGTLDVLHPKGGDGGSRDEEASTTQTGPLWQNEAKTEVNEIIGGGVDNDGNDGVVLRFAQRFGLSRREAYAIYSYSRTPESSLSSTMPFSCMRDSEANDVDTMKRAFWKLLVDATPLDGAVEDVGMTLQLSDEDRQRNLVASSDELEAIESIFIGDGELAIERNDQKTCVSIALPQFGNDKLFLEVSYADGFYPDVPPTVFVVSAEGLDSCGDASYHCGGKVHLDLVRNLSEMGHGREVIFELFGVASSLLQEEADSPSTAASSVLLSHLQKSEENGDTAAEINDEMNSRSTMQYSTPSKEPTIEVIHQVEADELINLNQSHAGGRSSKRERPTRPTIRRPRDRDTFWNVPPKDIPLAASPIISPALTRERKSLPAAAARGEFLSLLARAADCGGRVLLVTGETGCGKTTQIPQFILESSPTKSKIVVAQPRRLAVTGVASRVASERGESRPGIATVGYVVRGGSKTCALTRLLFCTTGVLLRQLQSRNALENISHIVIDEVHERHLDTDVLLAILKKTLPSLPNLIVVLMSATMDADRFAKYWGERTPKIHIPGRTFPVQDFSLEDVLEMTRYIPPNKNKKKKESQYFRGDSGGSNLTRPSFKENDDSRDDGERPVRMATSSIPEVCVVPLDERLRRVNEQEIDYDLIAVLIKTLLQMKEDDGSILIFLPGAGEIEKAERAICQIVKGFNFIILPLHGGLQTEKQQLVFVPAHKGCTKVILSTNVAETSITIPDCTIVVDTCKEKQSSFDPTNRMPLLLERFSSRDSLKQRRGRAGRVRAGTCYKLISSSLHDKLPEHGEPEIMRCALDQTLLSLIYLGLENGSGEFTRTLLDPPSCQSIDSALQYLEKIGALSRDEGLAFLTPLGTHLAGIPSPPAVGKLLVMGCLLGCRETSIAIAAGMSVGRSPFLRIDSCNNENRLSENEIEQEKEFTSSRITKERAALFKIVGNSDHVLLGKAYLMWRDSNGTSERKRFCDKLGLAFNGMRDMLALTRQFDSSLSSLGFLPSTACNSNENSWRIVRSVVVASLSPTQIIRVQRPSAKYTETVEGAVEKKGEAKELKFFVRVGGEHITCKSDRESANRSNVNEERVFIHPSSSLFVVGTFSCPWLVYHRLIHTTKAFVNDATECNPYSLLLFGGPMEVQASKGLIVLNNWIYLSANARIGSLIGGLRKIVDDLLEQKVVDPSLDISDSSEMKLITELLRQDGV